MEFDDVRTFVAVADSGSVSLAARDLHVTQSAVTRRLQRLEISLGAELLDRRTRPVSLTGPGQAALERCRRLLNDARELRAATAAGDFLMGEMRIGVAHALTELTLSEPVGQVRSMFPRIALRLRTGWSRELLERVRSAALDAAVILLPQGEQLPAEVVGSTVGEEHLVFVASREYRRSAKKVQDLAGVQWVLNPEGCAARATLRRALLQANLNMIVAVEAYSYELQLKLVAENRGLSLVPERILKSSRTKSRLRTLRVPDLEFPLTIWTVHQEPFSGLDRVIAELNRTLSEKLRTPPRC
jgi:DNA-binding transcriptional LysR family regulator